MATQYTSIRSIYYFIDLFFIYLFFKGCFFLTKKTLLLGFLFVCFLGLINIYGRKLRHPLFCNSHIVFPALKGLWDRGVYASLLK